MRTYADEKDRTRSRAARHAWISGAGAIVLGVAGLLLVGLYLRGVYVQRVSALDRGHITADLFLSAVFVVLVGIAALMLASRSRRISDSFGLRGAWVGTMGLVLGVIVLCTVPFLIWLGAWVPWGPEGAQNPLHSTTAIIGSWARS